MAKITPESIADLKALFQDNEKALGSNFSQLIDFFNDNKVTDNGDGTFTVGAIMVDASKLYNLINNSSPNILPLDNEFTGKNTFDIAPINKANGKPYITEDSVPPVDLSNYPTKDQLATKADTSAIDPRVMIKKTLTANDDVLALDPGTYYTWGVKPNNYPALSPWSTVVVKTVGNQPMDGKNVTITDTNASQLVNTYSGNPPTGKWFGWRVPNSTAMASKTDVTTAINAATANMADTTKAANFTSGLQSGGVDVATAADLKSIEDSAWRQLDNKYVQTVTGATVSPNTTILYKVDDVNKKLYIQGSVLTMSQNLVNATVNLNSIVKTVTGGHVRYLGLKSGYSNWTLIDADIRTPTSIVFSLNSGTAGIVNDIGNGSLSYITYDELV
ncbi:hypothetical protein SAC12B_0079 [Lactobacillus phage SAC12B]|uniref:Uncharacterized protein n=1 Tax=Lactobacillus phage SAC12B TaxID=2510941 RepID=A0A4Y5FH72_9CAUD|nr:hypothetical protein HWC10_gp079 [Lactobacillus phage SAC12B]QBJ03868.1 hypothetical protein SAC12B_0079 [Lactobacillus phage SAC12B]